MSLTTVVTDITSLKRVQEQLRFQASYDMLTGLINRRALEHRISDEVMRANRYGHSFSVFMIDIDLFKTINDTYGHKAGDRVLSDFAGILKESIRITDYAARYGGEEFVVILPETAMEKAVELGERLRLRVVANPFFIKEGTELNISISIGVAAFPDHGRYWQELIEAADKAMYTAKKSGRNRVIKALI